MWESLPLKLRAEFGNNKYEFLEKGMAWAQKQENARLEKLKASQNNPISNPTTTGSETVQQNETKGN